MKFFAKALFAFLTVVLIALPAMTAGSFDGTDLGASYQQGTIAYGNVHFGAAVSADAGPMGQNRDEHDDGLIRGYFDVLADNLRINIKKEFAQSNNLYLSILWDIDNNERFSAREALVLNSADTEWHWIRNADAIMVNGLISRAAFNFSRTCSTLMQSGFRIILSDAPISLNVVLGQNFDLSPIAGEIEDYRLDQLVLADCASGRGGTQSDTDTSDNGISNAGQNGGANNGGKTIQQTSNNANNNNSANAESESNSNNDGSNSEQQSQGSNGNNGNHGEGNNGQGQGSNGNGGNTGGTESTGTSGADKDKQTCNAGKGNDSETDEATEEDCDPGNSAENNNGGD